MNPWAEWLAEVTRGASERSVAAQMSASRTSLARWLESGKPPAQAVIEISQAYDVSFMAGLIAAGILTERDLLNVRAEVLKTIPTRDLVAELHARGSRSSERGFYDPPTDPTRWPPSS